MGFCTCILPFLRNFYFSTNCGPLLRSACIASIIRFAYTVQLINDFDVTWNFSKLSLWTCVSPQAVYLCPLRPFTNITSFLASSRSTLASSAPASLQFLPLLIATSPTASVSAPTSHTSNPTFLVASAQRVVLISPLQHLTSVRPIVITTSSRGTTPRLMKQPAQGIMRMATERSQRKVCATIQVGSNKTILRRLQRRVRILRLGFRTIGSGMVRQRVSQCRIGTGEKGD